MAVTTQIALSDLPGAESIDKFDNSDLVCRLHQNLYGLPIKAIQEILPMPSILPLPQLPEAIIGVYVFRGQIIPVLNLSNQLKLEGEAPKTGQWQLVVTAHDDRHYALAVTDIIEIINYADNEVEPLPTTSEGEEYIFHGIKRTKLGIVTLLNMLAIVEQSNLPARTSEQTDSDQALRNYENLSLINIGPVKVAVAIDEIERILRQPRLLPVNDGPPNIIGKVLPPNMDEATAEEEDYFPVLDMFGLLGQNDPSSARNLILPKGGEHPLGFYTGSVEEIRQIDKTNISLMPPLTATGDNYYFKGILKLEDELVFLLDLDQIRERCLMP